MPTPLFKSADSSSIKGCGKASFNVEIRGLQLKHECIVVEMSDEELLVIDLLQNSPSGPADIPLSQGVIEWQDQEIPGFRVELPESVSRVEAIGDYKLPCHNEAMIKVKVNVDAANKKMKGYCVTESSFFY